MNANEINKIRVSKTKQGERVLVVNPTDFPLIGKGMQGAVFKLSSNRCVKIYWNPKLAKKEAEVFMKGKGYSFLPQVYEIGDNYIIMEYIQGSSLQEFVLRDNLPVDLVMKVMEIFREMKMLEFTNVDAATRHIIVTEEGNLKVLDLVNAYSKKQPYPLRFLNRLRKLSRLESFLNDVNTIDAEVYKEWKENIPEYFTTN
ncbi:serine/threonine protein kinase [Bacillus cereus group sp. MYBK30-1]|uniref:serine/threonine protein kinase n=1 Tax=unclassified Bacillus cereus group TaxID=2750818 RepID=UPI003F7A8E56